MAEIRTVDCPVCGGDGGHESAPHSMAADGSPLTHWITCGACNGACVVEIEVEPVTLADLDEQREQEEAAHG